jgi:hypothetical protein
LLTPPSTCRSGSSIQKNAPARLHPFGLQMPVANFRRINGLTTMAITHEGSNKFFISKETGLSSVKCPLLESYQFISLVID